MYDASSVTLGELVRMARLLGWDGAIASRHYGWGLFAVTAAMGNPCTHRENLALGQRLVLKLTGDPEALLTTHRLHYARPHGGLRSDMQAGYRPDRFGDRISSHPFTAPGEWSLLCTDHDAAYDLCTEGCAIGVQRGGEYLIDIVRREGSAMPSPSPAGRLGDRQVSDRTGFAAIARGCATGIVEARRERDERTVTLNVGDLREGVRLHLPAVGIPDSNDDAMDMCQVLETDRFRRGARVLLIGKDGPNQGVGTVYRFRIC